MVAAVAALVLVRRRGELEGVVQLAEVEGAEVVRAMAARREPAALAALGVCLSRFLTERRKKWRI